MSAVPDFQLKARVKMIQREIGGIRLSSAFATLMLSVACGTNPVTAPQVNVRINELSSSNHDFRDSLGNTGDWIELYNLGDTDVNLAGSCISDSANKRFKSVLGNDVVVPARGLLLLWADGQPNEGDTHLTFKLSSSGDGVWLSNSEGYVVDSIEFGSIPTNDAGTEDTSLARFPDGTGKFIWCSKSSPEELNGDHCTEESL